MNEKTVVKYTKLCATFEPILLAFPSYMVEYGFGLVWFVGFYGISTFVGYLMPNPFLCK